jgi:hypothetical protein
MKILDKLIYYLLLFRNKRSQEPLKLWRTNNGDYLVPEQMSTSHIKNCVNMLKRKGYVSPQTVTFYNTCSLPIGEMAMDAFDMEYEQVMDAPISDILGIFEDILEKRGEL